MHRLLTLHGGAGGVRGRHSREQDGPDGAGGLGAAGRRAPRPEPWCARNPDGPLRSRPAGGAGLAPLQPRQSLPGSRVAAGVHSLRAYREAGQTVSDSRLASEDEVQPRQGRLGSWAAENGLDWQLSPG